MSGLQPATLTDEAALALAIRNSTEDPASTEARRTLTDKASILPRASGPPVIVIPDDPHQEQRIQPQGKKRRRKSSRSESLRESSRSESFSDDSFPDFNTWVPYYVIYRCRDNPKIIGVHHAAWEDIEAKVPGGKFAGSGAVNGKRFATEAAAKKYFEENTKGEFPYVLHEY